MECTVFHPPIGKCDNFFDYQSTENMIATARIQLEWKYTLPLFHLKVVDYFRFNEPVSCMLKLSNISAYQ
jgi:hypothetical protein